MDGSVSKSVKWLFTQRRTTRVTLSRTAGSLNLSGRAQEAWIWRALEQQQQQQVIDVPLEELTADNQRTVDKDAMSQKEVFDVAGIAGRVFQQVGH